MKVFPVALLLGAASMFANDSAHANLVANGSFETGAFTNESCNYMSLSAGDSSLDGWDVNSAVAWGLNACDFGASDGFGFVDLSGFGAQSPDGEIAQTVNLTAGVEYTFSIDHQGGDILVTLDGTPILLSATGSTGGWTTFTGAVTATSSLSVLAITNNAPGNTIVFVDNVSLAAVPLPGALVFMASGLALLGRLRRS